MPPGRVLTPRQSGPYPAPIRSHAFVELSSECVVDRLAMLHALQKMRKILFTLERPSIIVHRDPLERTVQCFC